MTIADLRAAATATATIDAARSKPSVAKAWSRALELTAPIARQTQRILSTVIEEQTAAHPDAPALVSARESFSYRELAERARRYARWARTQQLARGEAVCLLMPNRPEYMAVWLGVTSVGGVVALLNTNLTGMALARCIDVAKPAHIIVAAELVETLRSALGAMSTSPRIWIHGADGEWPRIDRAVDACPADPLAAGERVATVEDPALYIYTSGTTGLPKAARVSHARIMQWSHWFAGLADVRADDRMYNCLPMYHSVGGVLATGAVLVGGGSVAIRDKFSARQFWSDIADWDCTLFQYIGELCRYLLHAPPHPAERAHRLRMCCGNGLRGDVWEPFRIRFAIPQILEFYASTEGNVSLFNVEGRPGAIGRIPGFLAHRFPAAVVKFDTERELPVRNEQGFCTRCAPNEPGEALGQISGEGSNVGARFEGYTDDADSQKKILRNVFKPGDAWFRTGDLMRRDEQGYFYFVDRIGDTFRWKGENVATSEVAEAVCAFPGITDATVYGVPVPGTEGRAAMAAITTSQDVDLGGLRAFLLERLPRYACPLFLRFCRAMELTATFKQTRNGLAREGYDPAATTDPIYFDHPERGAFVRLDAALFDDLQQERMKL